MAEILLFHHVRGLTPGVVAFADLLRGDGHTVHSPDLFDGQTFDSIEAGMAHVEGVGFETVLDRGVACAEGLPDDLVYIGFSLGAAAAQRLAQTRPGARGAVLLDACIPPSYFGEWPAGLPAQVHGMTEDPFFAGEGDIEAARALADANRTVQLYLYPGDQHLFADSSLAGYDAGAAALVTRRVRDFVTAIEPRPGIPTVVEVTIDCTDAATLASFWTRALGYIDISSSQEPGRGHAWLHDPRGNGPHVALIEVPEPRSVKNRMHLDLMVSGDVDPDERWRRISAEVQRLTGLGATVTAEFPTNHVAMADPEGNEFDVC